MNERPVVSVIVPVYNSEKYLSRCVESLINQTYGKFELILVDDGSKDKSAQICDAYKEKDSRIKVIHQQNGGVSKARNAGIRCGVGKYYSFLDSDDWLAPTSLEFLVNEAEYKSADVVLCDYAEVYSDVVLHRKSFETGDDKLATISNMIQFGPRGSNIWNFLLVRASLIKENSLYFPVGMKYGEDFWFTLHAYVLAKIIAKVEDNLYFYDLSNAGSATHNIPLDKSASFLEYYDDCIVFLKEKKCWELLKDDVSKRILQTKTAWAVRPSCFRSYQKIHPEVNRYVNECHFLNSKMRLQVRLLNRNLYVIPSIIALLYKLSASFRRLF